MTGDLEFRPVNEENWQDLAGFFEARGGPKYCWCMAWRKKSPEAKQRSAAGRNAVLKTDLHDRVAEGVPIGLLAYRDGQPVAWCSVAPRPTFRRLGGPESAPKDKDAVWSLVCFFVHRSARGQGMTERLLHAAIAYARDKGGKVLEAYPVDPESPSYHFMGVVGLFETAGFEKVGRAGSRRYVVRLPL